MRSSSPSGPTMAEVARHAGVSVPTVSKVLNGREDVAAETRRHVEAALHDLGYQRRERLRSPAHQGSVRTIDLVVHQLGSTWTAAIVEGAEEAAHEAGLHLVVNAMLGRTRHTRTERGWLERISARGTRGVVTALAHFSASQDAWFRRNQVPYVMLDPISPPPRDTYSVAAANWEGARSAVDHLLDLGHRRIAIIAGRRGRHCSDLRIEGYRSAMRSAHARVLPGYVRNGAFTPEGGEESMRALLGLPTPPTAVFVCSDFMSLGVLRAAREHGVRVPEDISVVSFDDLPEARWTVPELTTVQQPLNEMAATAVRLLMRLSAGDVPGSHRTELSTTLTERASTAPPPQIKE